MSSNEIAWVDTHCHLDDSLELATVLTDAFLSNVVAMIMVGTDIGSSLEVMNLAVALADAKENGVDLLGFLNSRFSDKSASDFFISKDTLDNYEDFILPDVWAVVGVHPHDAKSDITPLHDMLKNLENQKSAKTGSVVGIGECGLDYHYDNSPREKQKEAFVDQISLAHQFNLSLVVHTRDAWQDTFGILKENTLPEHTIIHCFTGGVDEARVLIDMGAYISFSGIVTFKNAVDIQEAARFCPLDRLLIETDSPYLTPVPHRGVKNHPAFVRLVGEKIAELRGISPAVLAQTTFDNARKAFSLK